MPSHLCTGAVVTNIVMDNCPVNYATFRSLGCKLSRNYRELNTSTDIKNNMGHFVMALFDAPHLAKLGKFFQNYLDFLQCKHKEKCAFLNF